MNKKESQIDQLDKEILYMLDFHARDPVSKLAKKLKMSEDTLNYRIKRLEKREIIMSYYVVPDTTKLGLISYKVMLKYQNTTTEIENKIIEYLKKTPEAGWIVRSEGCYDLMLIVWIANEITFDLFFVKFLDQFSQYFYLRDTVIITENHACQKAYLSLNEVTQKEEVWYGGESKNICDETDRKILALLTENARLPSIEIANRLGLTPEAISHRIRMLRKKGAIGTFRPRINLGKIGYYFYNVLFRLNKTSVIPALFAYAKQNPNITYFVKYVGAYDVGFDVEAESPEHFRKILEDIRNRFGTAISHYDYVSIYDEVKITY